MDSVNLEPGYSTNEIPGKCIKCLGEHELNNCLLMLLRGEGEEPELVRRFESLASFLKSPESQRLRDASERLLAEGKHVTVTININSETGQPEFELKVIE